METVHGGHLPNTNTKHTSGSSLVAGRSHRPVRFASSYGTSASSKQALASAHGHEFPQSVQYTETEELIGRLSY
jgi:hypothetical protein